MKTFLVGELAKLAGVNKETIRYYESKGLLDSPDRRASGGQTRPYREYTTETVERIKIIKELKNLGFTLREIKTLFELYEEDTSTCDDLTEAIDIKIESIEQNVMTLQAQKKNLQSIIAKCKERNLLQSCNAILELRRRALDDDS